MNFELVSKFEHEREQTAKQMQDLVQQLAQQQEAIMQRLQQMPAQDAIQLEREKQMARDVYEAREMHRSSESGVIVEKLKSQDEVNRENMESMIRVKQTKVDQNAIERALGNQEQSMRKNIQEKEEVKKATPQ